MKRQLVDLTIEANENDDRPPPRRIVFDSAGCHRSPDSPNTDEDHTELGPSTSRTGRLGDISTCEQGYSMRLHMCDACFGDDWMRDFKWESRTAEWGCYCEEDANESVCPCGHPWLCSSGRMLADHPCIDCSLREDGLLRQGCYCNTGMFRGSCVCGMTRSASRPTFGSTNNR